MLPIALQCKHRNVYNQQTKHRNVAISSQWKHFIVYNQPTKRQFLCLQSPNPVYKAHLAKERENPTQITSEGHLLWTKPYEESYPCRANKKFVSELLHRPDGLPAVILKDGTREWWVNGVLYRPGGVRVRSAGLCGG